MLFRELVLDDTATLYPEEDKGVKTVLDSLKRVQVSNRNTKRPTESRGGKDGEKTGKK